MILTRGLGEIPKQEQEDFLPSGTVRRESESVRSCSRSCSSLARTRKMALLYSLSRGHHSRRPAGKTIFSAAVLHLDKRKPLGKNAVGGTGPGGRLLCSRKMGDVRG